jgi:hypothetical protein
MLGTHRLKKGARVGTERLVTTHTVISAFAVTVDFDITGGNFLEIGTDNILTPVLVRIHGISPLITVDDTPNTLSRLR